ncbi:MAG: SDR family oxidoreductase [Methanolinea sp.]|nr:SDR family oxidoreductase [Methanolinea sp.]
MNYVVTGGAGFIGSHIIEYLVDHGHDVTVVDNLFSGKKENIRHLLDHPRFHFVQGSITDSGLLDDTFRNADGIFHQAAIPSVPRSIRDPVATNEVNVNGTLAVLMVAKKCGVRKVVYASSSSVYGDTPTLPKVETMTPHPKSPYAVSKLAGEYYCRVFSEVYGLKTVALRYFNVFGPRQDPESQYAAVIPRFITRVLAGQPPIIYGDGTQTRDFTYVKDVVQANVKAMESTADGVFNVAYNQRISILSLVDIIAEETGMKVSPVFEPPRPGDIHDSQADITAAQKAFGYAPDYTVRSGLKETIAWYRRNVAMP